MKSPRGPDGLSCPSCPAIGGPQDGAPESHRRAGAAVGTGDALKNAHGPAGLSCPASAAVGGRQDGATRSYRCASVGVGTR
jgi:hypothetical protein